MMFNNLEAIIKQLMSQKIEKIINKKKNHEFFLKFRAVSSQF